MNEHELDNMDTSNVQNIAYFIWRECQHIDDSNVMGTSFYNACRDLANAEFPHIPFNDIWHELESYLY